MSVEEIQQRLQDLHSVLWYCSDMQKEGRIYVFKTGERICINQERGALLSQLSRYTGENSPEDVRTYQLPAHIEAKVKFTLERIETTHWGTFQEIK